MDSPYAEDRGYALETSKNLCACDGDLSITRHDAHHTHCDGLRMVSLTVMTGVVTHVAGMEDLVHILEHGSQRLRTDCSEMTSAAQ